MSMWEMDVTCVEGTLRMFGIYFVLAFISNLLWASLLGRFGANSECMTLLLARTSSNNLHPLAKERL